MSHITTDGIHRSRDRDGGEGGAGVKGINTDNITEVGMVMEERE